jgi:phage major tail protein, phi13 family
MAKIKYGLRNVFWALVTETTVDNVTTSSYGSLNSWPGAVNLSLSANQDKVVFRADDSDYYVSYGEGQYEGSLETALIPEALKAALGWVNRDDNDIAVESSEDYKTTKYVALLFEFQNDTKATRHCLYKVSFSRADLAGQTTGEGGQIEPQTETVNLTAVPRADADRYIHAYADENSDSAAYSAWYTAVPVPTFTP